MFKRPFLLAYKYEEIEPTPGGELLRKERNLVWDEADAKEAGRVAAWKRPIQSLGNVAGGLPSEGNRVPRRRCPPTSTLPH